MLINYNVTGPTRKALVKAVSDYLNQHAVYQFTPTYAYRIGCFTVTKEGALEFDDVDHNIIKGVYEAIKAAGFEAPAFTTTAVGEGSRTDEETSNADEDGTGEGHTAAAGETVNQDADENGTVGHTNVDEEDSTGDGHTDVVDDECMVEENSVEAHTGLVSHTDVIRDISRGHPADDYSVLFHPAVIQHGNASLPQQFDILLIHHPFMISEGKEGRGDGCAGAKEGKDVGLRF